RAPSLHSSHLIALLERFGSVTAIATASATALRECGAPESLIDWLRSPQRSALIDGDRRWLDHESRHYVPWGAPEDPRLLAELSEGPIGLCVRGRIEPLSSAQLAIVGSRTPRPSGRETARDFAGQLSRCGVTVASGLAVG